MLAAAIAALVGTWFRHREPEIVDEAAPGTAQWPPLTPLPGDKVPAPGDNVPAPGDDTTGDAADDTAAGDTAVDDTAADAVGDPDDGTAAAEASWVAPDDEGNCPLTHPVKVKESSGIHHVPGGFSYERTNADRCYQTPDAAESDGYRAAKR